MLVRHALIAVSLLAASASVALVAQSRDLPTASRRDSLHVGGCTANTRMLEAIDKAALLAWLQ